MNEEKEVEILESHEHEEHEPGKQRSASNAAIFVTLLAIVALGSSFFLWRQLQLANKDINTIQASIDKLLGVMEENLKQIPTHQHPELQQNISRNAAQAAQQNNRLQMLTNRLAQERSGWTVAEAEYLIRIAEHRLTLERDIPTAIAALGSAKQVLLKADSATFAVVASAIDVEINKLQSLQLPNPNLIAAEVAALSAAVEELPLALGAIQSAGLPQESGDSAQESSGEGFWQRIWQDIRGLVTIHREGEVDKPMLVPEQRYFLKQNLQLKLETARMALLTNNTATWYASLDQASDWLQRYFDTSTEGVTNVLQGIARLRQIDLSPPLPLPEGLHQVLQQAAIGQPAAEPPQTTLPPQAPVQSPEPEVPEQSSETTPASPEQQATEGDTSEQAPVTTAPEKPSTPEAAPAPAPEDDVPSAPIEQPQGVVL